METKGKLSKDIVLWTILTIQFTWAFLIGLDTEEANEMYIHLKDKSKIITFEWGAFWSKN